MLSVNHLIGFGAGSSGVDASVTYVNHYESSSALSSYTFSSCSIGTAATGRRVIVGIAASGGSAATASVTIGGNAATQAEYLDGTASGSVPSGIYILQVDAGTTADIVVTFSSSRTSCGITVLAAYDLLSSTKTFSGNSQANPPSVGSVSCSAGGIIVAQVAIYSGTTSTLTWTGLTERYDGAVISQISQSVAADAFSSAQSGVTVTATPSQSPTNRSLCVASFR